jgi:broad specificity phosphatase PhoE
MKLNNKYFLLRHGQTIYQKEGREFNYPADSGAVLSLTEEGKEMIRNSAENLKKICNDENFSIDLIFASPFLRTKQSAEIAGNILDIKEINYDERLVDIDLGEFMGKSMQESHNFYLGDKVTFNNKPKGGESWNDVLNRVKSFLDEVEQKYSNKNILIISHADPIWLMLGYLRGYNNEQQYIEVRKDRQNSYPKVAQLIKL